MVKRQKETKAKSKAKIGKEDEGGVLRERYVDLLCSPVDPATFNREECV